MPATGLPISTRRLCARGWVHTCTPISLRDPIKAGVSGTCRTQQTRLSISGNFVRSGPSRRNWFRAVGALVPSARLHPLRRRTYQPLFAAAPTQLLWLIA